MSVTITLTDSQRTELLMLCGFARECAAVYELYAPSAVKPYWVQRRDTAQELFDLLNEEPRDVEECDAVYLTANGDDFKCVGTKGHFGRHASHNFRYTVEWAK